MELATKAEEEAGPGRPALGARQCPKSGRDRWRPQPAVWLHSFTRPPITDSHSTQPSGGVHTSCVPRLPARRTSPGEGRPPPGNGGMCSPGPFPAPPPPPLWACPAARPLPLTMSVSICPRVRPLSPSWSSFVSPRCPMGAGSICWRDEVGAQGLPPARLPGTPHLLCSCVPSPPVPPGAGAEGWHLEGQSLEASVRPQRPSQSWLGAGPSHSAPPQPQGNRNRVLSQRGVGRG